MSEDLEQSKNEGEDFVAPEIRGDVGGESSERQAEFSQEQMKEIEKLSGEIIDATKKIRGGLSEDEDLLIIEAEIQGEPCPLSPVIYDKDEQGNPLNDQEMVYFDVGYPGHSIQYIPRLHSIALGRKIENFSCFSMDYVKYYSEKRSLSSSGIYEIEKVREDLFNVLRDLRSELTKTEIPVVIARDIKI